MFTFIYSFCFWRVVLIRDNIPQNPILTIKVCILRNCRFEVCGLEFRA